MVGKYSLGERMELFARCGYGHTELKQEIAGETTDVGGGHWSYSAGATYNLDGANGVLADWTRRDFEGDSNELDSYSLSYVRRF